jgi:thioredoxin
MKTQQVTMENFDDVMEQNPLVVLDFWAEWCQPCKVFGPIFEQLAELNPDVFFGKVNTELSLDLAQAFQVRSIPTLMAFKDGDLVFEKSGLIPPRDIEAMLELLRR